MTQLTPVVLDFETYFDDEYTLKKLTTETYVRDPRFEAHGVGLYFPAKGRSVWVPQDQVHSVFAAMDWTKVMAVAHHAQFDGLILSHHYGKSPAKWVCTMSLARMVRGLHNRVSLAALAEAYGMAEKSVPYNAMRGMHWGQMYPELRQTLADGCLHDCELTWGVLTQLMRYAPPAEELHLIDLTVRMFTEPVLEGDRALLTRVAEEEAANKERILSELGVGRDDLQSADRFVQLLEAEGVEVEYKAGKKGPIPAIAKTDDFMKGLLDDADERVATLASARLQVRSTIDETRAGRLGSIASRGRLPVYLNYYGAHTGRWSGGDRINLQNLPRKSDLRTAIIAPQGFVLSIVDAAQIECRILNTFAEQHDVVEAFRTGADLYSRLASRFYGRPINKKDNPTERHLGKTLELGCGYGMGSGKLQITCRRGALGGPPIFLKQDEATAAIDTYRSTHQAVVALWKTAGRMIAALAGTNTPVDWNCVRVETGRLALPNGAWNHYPDLQHDPSAGSYGEWTYQGRNGRIKLYGAKLVENLIQALARIATSQAMLRVQKAGIKIATMSHDETVCVLPASEAEAQHAFIIQEMRRPLPWLPNCPLEAEGSLSERYEK